MSYEARDYGSVIKHKSRRGSNYEIRYWIETDADLETYLPVEIGSEATWVENGTSALTGGGFVKAYVTDFKILAVGPGNAAPYILVIYSSCRETGSFKSAKITDQISSYMTNGEIYLDPKFFGIEKADAAGGGVLKNADGSFKERDETKARFKVDFTKAAGTPSERAEPGDYIFSNGDTVNAGSANYSASPFNENIDVRRMGGSLRTTVLRLGFYVKGIKNNNYAQWAGVNVSGEIPTKFRSYFFTTTNYKWRAVDQYIRSYYDQNGNRYTHITREMECAPSGFTWNVNRNGGTWDWVS